MKFLVKTLLWLVLLVAVIAGIGREYVLKFWGGRDALLKQVIVSKLHDFLPDATIEFDEPRYDFGHEISITGFSLRPAGQEIPIVKLPESVVHLDRDPTYRLATNERLGAGPLPRDDLDAIEGEQLEQVTADESCGARNQDGKGHQRLPYCASM